MTITTDVFPPVSYKNKTIQVSSGGNVLYGMNTGMLVGIIRKGFQNWNNSRQKGDRVVPSF